MRIKAFTLIELLVVVAIIGILGSIGVVSYDGYTKSTKKGKCYANAKFFKDEILRKWMNATLKDTPDIEMQKNGFCFLHFIPSNASFHSEGTNITDLRKSNKSVPTLCNHDPQGSEHTYHDHFYGLGYRNPLIGNFGVWNDKPGLDTPGRGNTLREGGSVLRCGANAGLTNKKQCKLITLCESGNQRETILTKE